MDEDVEDLEEEDEDVEDLEEEDAINEEVENRTYQSSPASTAEEKDIKPPLAQVPRSLEGKTEKRRREKVKDEKRKPLRSRTNRRKPGWPCSWEPAQLLKTLTRSSMKKPTWTISRYLNRLRRRRNRQP